MKKALLLFSSIAAFVLSGCNEYEVDMFGSISGVVSDSEMNEPLSGVKVALSPGGVSQVTSNDGTFAFEGLSAQEYSLTFTRTGYASQTQKVAVKAGVTSSVQVTLETSGPVLYVSEEKLDFEADLTMLSFDIRNDGDGELEWKISENADWIKCSESSGTTGNGTSSVTVTVSRSDMDPGTYRETIVVTSNGGGETIEVTMTVQDIFSQFYVTPESLDFGTEDISLELRIYNACDSEINWTAESENGWVILDRKSGSLQAGDEERISVIVSREGLSAGDYTSGIRFMAGGKAVDVPVRMSVASEEKPVVSIERVSGITYSSASVSGAIISVGTSGVSRYGFCWSTSQNPTLSGDHSDMGDCISPKAFTGTISNLKSETKYYVRAYAENNEGISYSEKTLSFTTSSYGGGGSGDDDEPVVEDYSSATVESGDSRIVPEITSCKRSGSTVTLTYTLRNNGLGSINDFRIYTTNSNSLISGGYRTVITDENYNNYVTSTYKFNNVTQSQNYVLNAIFPDRVKVTGSVTVPDFDRSAERLTVILGIWAYGETLADPRIYFEDVPIY